jgi:nucleoid-associated protein
MSIKHVIVHVVKRDEDGEKLSKQLRDKENDQKSLASKLTTDLLNLFSSASLSIGEFGVNGDESLKPPFEQQLERFYNESLKCTDFVKLTQELASYFESTIIGRQLHSVKGGYLVFYHYESRANDWLGVAILNRTDGIDVSGELDIVASQLLDLNKLYLGAAINLTQWRSGLSDRYIRFKTGLAGEVRDYFEAFIGCQRDKEAAKVETASLKKAIREFGVKQELSDDVISHRIAAAHTFIIEQQKSKKPVLLSHLANYVFPDASADFLIHTADNHSLSEELAIDQAVLRSYLKISGRGRGLSITFDRELLDKNIKYERGTLTITDLPDTLKFAIEEELKSRTTEKNTAQ